MEKIRVNLIVELEDKIWKSKNNLAIKEWDNYTDILPLGYWKDIDSCILEVSINFADKIIRKYKINGNHPTLFINDDIQKSRMLAEQIQKTTQQNGEKWRSNG